ncbi:serine--tRNA ligase [Candidatus Pacearchaeota archaeon CG10_big_fil_rev_8_21_14_0_10_34_76]|nr:MAG: serine--tRNA ligase [Candidatus Pacearchaeota archaeon CG10_big_fil_rev_8_21_14_0_10_34_76]
MIDIKLIRDNEELVRENIKKKFQNDKLKILDKIIEKDKEWRKFKSEVDSLRGERNKVSKEVAIAKKAGKSVTVLMKKASEIPGKIDKLEGKMNHVREEIDVFLLQIPNIISDKTPVGKDESQNVEIKKWGKIPKFNFPVKNHVEIVENLGIADFEASAKVSGNGFYYLKGDLALLNSALIRFAIDFMNKKGYTYIEPPLMLNEKSIFASMDRKAIEESVYSIKDESLNLIGTAEQPLLAMHTNQIFTEAELPKKYFSYTMCFRKEIGSHGINEKGLWRTHQFNKVEQFVFCKAEDSEKIYDELLNNSEGVLQTLNLPYRVLEICSGDMADWKFRSADLEVYRPTTNSYGEVMSLSNCTDYQARKLSIRYDTRQGERKIVNTLNNTTLATSRIMVAILENNQQKDGSVNVPDVLVPYMNGKKVIGKK